MSSTPYNPALVTAAILSGGAGRRLGGRDKGLELLAGRPMISHVIQAIRPQASNLLICTSRNISLYAQFAVTCSDQVGGFAGPMAAIVSALKACSTPWLLTTPVDCPRPASRLAIRLHAANARVAVAHDGSRRQPLFALYRREVAATAESALAADMGVWQWQDALGAVAVDFSAVANSFVNLNTREDFRQWERANEE